MAQRPDDSIRTTVAGEAFTLTRSDVERGVDGVLPDPVVDHYVVVSGRRYPPKQVLALVTGLDRSDFTTHQARRTMRRLGFAVGRKPAGPPTVTTPSELGPHGGAEADALRPYIGKWVAQKGLEVLVAADTPLEVVDWLHKHDVHADGVFRVPVDPDRVHGAAPF